MLHPCRLQLPQALLARGANKVSLLAQQSTEHIQIPSPAPAATHNPVPSVRRHGEADNLSLEPKWLQFGVWHRTWSILVCYRCQGEATNSNLPSRPTLGGSFKAMRVGTPTSRSTAASSILAGSRTGTTIPGITRVAQPGWYTVYRLPSEVTMPKVAAMLQSHPNDKAD